jgi:uncharacterized protein YdiU (UPF0061 family)
MPFSPDALSWCHRYARLGPPFVHAQSGQALPVPRWVATSDAAADDLGWPADWWQAEGALAAFSAGTPWPGMAPVSTVYSGHQFGVWAGQLGDGRALLLGEVDAPAGPREIQLKGSGLTPYSRMGDGRAVLRSSIREFLCSEAMHALGIPTTRALALVDSDLPVRRERPERAAIVTRTAPSFLRFGHFEHFCHHARGDFGPLRRLLDFVITHHYPDCRDDPPPAVALLAAVSRRTATLLADWQAVGFCHGVMNTDNLSILGLTIDYGPFGFLDGFDPTHVCNHSDHQGRYAYARQPQVAYWNLHALAQALVPLVDAPAEEAAERLGDALEVYREIFPAALAERMFAKLGLATRQDGDQALLDDLMRLMARWRADYTLVWRRLGEFRTDLGESSAAREPVRDLFVDAAAFDAWAVRYADRLRQEHSVDAERQARMHAVNPRYVLRNHLAEIAIQRAEEGDAREVRRLLAVLSRPFDEQPEHDDCAGLPPEWAQSLAISCSS